MLVLAGTGREAPFGSIVHHQEADSTRRTALSRCSLEVDRCERAHARKLTVPSFPRLPASGLVLQMFSKKSSKSGEKRPHPATSTLPSSPESPARVGIWQDGDSWWVGPDLLLIRRFWVRVPGGAPIKARLPLAPSGCPAGRDVTWEPWKSTAIRSNSVSQVEEAEKDG